MISLKQGKSKLRIVSEKIVSKKDPSKVIGHDPTQFLDLIIACQATVKTMETGDWYVPQSRQNLAVAAGGEA